MNKLQDQNRAKIALSLAVFRILKPLAKFTIRRGMSIGAMIELARRAYLEAATELLSEEQTKVTASRICAMTGMYRKEIRRLEELPKISDTETDDKYNRSTRVITGWLRDEEFKTKSGKPAALKLEGPNSFESLVRKYSGDMTPNAMHQELERLGAVSVSSRGMIRLETAAYLNSSATDGIHILGTDTAELIDTITNNIVQATSDAKRFQRKVSYTNIPLEKSADFYQYAETESQNLLEKLDRWLNKASAARKDKDNCKVSVGVYHFSETQNQSGTRATAM